MEQKKLGPLAPLVNAPAKKSLITDDVAALLKGGSKTVYECRCGKRSTTNDFGFFCRAVEIQVTEAEYATILASEKP